MRSRAFAKSRDATRFSEGNQEGSLSTSGDDLPQQVPRQLFLKGLLGGLHALVNYALSLARTSRGIIIRSSFMKASEMPSEDRDTARGRERNDALATLRALHARMRVQVRDSAFKSAKGRAARFYPAP
jgi:hypothetical protein